MAQREHVKYLLSYLSSCKHLRETLSVYESLKKQQVFNSRNNNAKPANFCRNAM